MFVPFIHLITREDAWNIRLITVKVCFPTCPAIVNKKTSRTRKGHFALNDLCDQRRCAPAVYTKRKSLKIHQSSTGKAQSVSTRYWIEADLLLFQCLMHTLTQQLKSKSKSIFITKTSGWTWMSNAYTKRTCRASLVEWLSNTARTAIHREWKSAQANQAIWFAAWRLSLYIGIDLILFDQLPHALSL